MNKNVLVVSAHPDDEILGAGGTLIRHRNNDDAITWIIITGLFKESGFSEERILSRKNEISEVAKRLDIKNVYHFDFPTMSLTDSDLGPLISKISKVFLEVKPEVVYVMNRSDAHSDHRVTFDAVAACTKSFRYPFISEVLMYECLSETEFAPALPEKIFKPTCNIDITDQMEEKIELMNVYESELGDHPFPRSARNIKALATFRGASCGVEYAEAFQIIKSYRFETL